MDDLEKLLRSPSWIVKLVKSGFRTMSADCAHCRSNSGSQSGTRTHRIWRPANSAHSFSDLDNISLCQCVRIVFQCFSSFSLLIITPLIIRLLLAPRVFFNLCIGSMSCPSFSTPSYECQSLCSTNPFFIALCGHTMTASILPT